MKRPDALIITALEDELEAVLALGEGGEEGWREERDRHGFRYWVREVRGQGGEPLVLVAAWAGDMGEVPTVSRAQQLIDELDPVCLAMCGICAGRRGEVSLGDVIVADRVYSYDHGKLIAGKRGESFWHDITTYNLEAVWKHDAAFFERELGDIRQQLEADRPVPMEAQRRWLLHAIDAQERLGGPAPQEHPERRIRCPRWSEVVQRLDQGGLIRFDDQQGALALTDEGRTWVRRDRLVHPDGVQDARFRVKVGTIATGKTVREDPQLFDKLRRVVRKTIGVEMEAAAIGHVAERSGRRSIIVKAVSDHGDHEKDDSFRGFACHASATVLLEFLRRFLAPRPRVRGSLLVKASLPRELVRAASDRGLLIYVGPGVAVGSGLPSRRELLQALWREAHRAASPEDRAKLEEARGWFLEEGEQRGKLSLLRRILGEAWLRATVASILGDAGGLPTDVHQALAGIEGATFLTINHDALLEQALEARLGCRPRTVLHGHARETETLQPGEVLKLYGDLTDPASLVFSVAEHRGNGTAVGGGPWQAALRRLGRLPRQVLLVGCDHEDAREVVEIFRGPEDPGHSSLFWLETGTAAGRVRAEALGMQLVPLGGEGEDPERLAGWLRTLADAVHTERARQPALASASPVQVEKLALYEERVRARFGEERDGAARRFNEQDHEGALEGYERIVRDAEPLVRADPEDRDIRRVLAQAQLNAAACLLNLGRNLEARERLERVAEERLEDLSSEGRAMLATALGQLGDLRRARAVLAGEGPERSEAGHHTLAEAQQLLDVLEGKLPDGEPASGIVRLYLARRLVGEGRHADAARHALVLVQEQAGNKLLLLYGTSALVSALHGTVQEEPSAGDLIPVADRGEIVAAVEQALGRLETVSLPPILLRIKARLLVDWADLVEDEERLDVARRAPTSSPTGSDVASPQGSDDARAFEEAENLAEQGRLDEALARLPHSSHPWHSCHQRASLMAIANRRDAALQELEDTLRRYPGRAPLEHLAAKLLAGLGRYQEALPHARAGFAALPGVGYRVLLGLVLVYAGEMEEAWAVLRPLDAPGAPTRIPKVLRALATAAERAVPEQAPALWDRYLEQRPDDAAIQLHRAVLAFRLGDLERVPDLAWKAWELPSSRQLGPRPIYEIAEMQRLGDGFSEERRERVRILAAVLADRFAGNPEAEQYRLLLLTELGFPGEAPRIDYDQLVDAGYLEKVSVDELAEQAHRSYQWRATAYHAYRTGHLPFESLCVLTDTPAARYFTGFLQIVGEGPTALCPPCGLALRSPPSLAGRRLLTGELELLIVHHLDLWRSLRHALGREGQVIVFYDVEERIGSGAAKLRFHTQPVALEEIHRLVRLLEDTKTEIVRQGEDVDDAAWAHRQGLPLVAEDIAGAIDRPTLVSPWRLADVLRDRGLIEEGGHRDILARLGPDPSPSFPADPVPARFVLGYVALMAFFGAGALGAVRRLGRDGLVVGPEAWDILQTRKRGLERAAEAADRAASLQRVVGAGIAEGWIQRIPRPAVPELPPLHPSHESEGSRLLRYDPLARALSYHQALDDDPGSLLLTADFFTAVDLSRHPDVLPLLAWPSREQAVELQRKLRRLDARRLTFPSLVRSLLPSAESSPRLIQLAELGFVDALEAEDLLAWCRPFGGADKEEPRRILDRIEWMARLPEHLGVIDAQMRLGFQYARAIWKAACGEDPLPASEAQGFAVSLLGRAEAVDDVARGTVLDRVFEWLAGAAANEPGRSLERLGPSAWRATIDSPAGRLWQALSNWAGAEGRRRAAWTRGVRQTWLILDELFKLAGPPPERAAPLLFASREAQPWPAITHALGGLAILSAEWKDKPLATLSVSRTVPETSGDSDIRLESVLQHGGARLGLDSDELQFGDDISRFRFPSLDGLHVMEVVTVSEAVLLRAPAQAVPSAARRLAELQGVHDGRAYERLMQLAAHPEDAGARRDVARQAVLLPFRLVREDASILLSWAASPPAGFPDDIGSLRQMLSEPGPLPSEGTLLSVLNSRRDPDKAWGDRPDGLTLAIGASAVPGLLPAFLMSIRFSLDEPAYSGSIADALWLMDHPAEAQAAQLAWAIYLLRAAAARRPQVTLPQGPVDVRSLLPERLVRLLRVVAGAPSTAGSTLADLEAGLLRLAGAIVSRLAQPGGLPFRDGIWLTYRLHQWICAQLDSLSPDERNAGLQALAPSLPPPDPNHTWKDVLHPRGFDRERGVDHRLLTVLHAIATAEVLVALLPEAEHPEAQLSVTSAPLEAALAEVASRPLTAGEHELRKLGGSPSCLDWHGPATVPDLALLALLSLRRDALFDLPDPVRLRWLLDLPDHPEDVPRAPWPLASRILDAIVRRPARLSGEERRVVEAWLRRLEGPPESGAAAWRWLGLTALYAGGERRLEDEVRSMLLERLEAKGAPDAFVQLLLGVGAGAPERLGAEAEQVLTAAAAAGVDPVPLLHALGRVMAESRRHEVVRAASEALRGFAMRPPYLGDARVVDLCAMMGIKIEEQR